MISRHCLLAIFLFLFLVPFQARAADQHLRALLFSGKNNHEWQATTPALKHVLEESGRFTVSVLDDPSRCDEQMLKDFDLIVSNWTNFPSQDRQWAPRAENAILEFVRSGKGFALVHAASACFATWPEYQQLIGATWGEKTGHGPYRAFTVSVADTAHPITRVVGDFVTDDELWHRMDKKPEAHVLCTAYSDTTGGGTGRFEPVAYTTEFGRGRGFYLVLGHDARAMSNPNWKMLLLRGAEWAATGQATIDVPFDIPHALREATTSAGSASQEQMAVLQQLTQSSSRNPSLRQALAKGMAQMLSADTPLDWKKFFCEQLSLIGSTDEVPALARILTDSSLGFHGRFALERIPVPASTDAMRQTAADAAGKPLIGLINTLGERKDAHAFELLERHDGHAVENAILKGAAIHALGKIGGPEAVRLLKSTRTDSSRELSLLRGESLLRCAGTSESAGEISEAVSLYELLNVPIEAPHIRAAAFAGLTRCRRDQASAMVLSAMKSGDEVLQTAVVLVLRGPGGKEVAAVVAEHVGTLPFARQAQAFYALADLGELSVLPAISRALSHRDKSLRLAALYSTGKLGDSSSVAPLCALIGRADARERAEIRKTLASLRGRGVNERLLALLAGKHPTAVRQEVIAALAARDCRDAVPALLKVAKGPRPEERKPAIKALGSLADPAISAELVGMLKSDRFAGEKTSLVKALISLGRRDQTPERVCNTVLAELPGTSPGVRQSMFQVLSEFGGEKSYQTVRASLTDPDPEVQNAAIRAFSAWPDISPMEDLFTFAHATRSTGTRLLAMRGGIGLLEASRGVSDADRLKIIERELQLAESGEIKRLLVSFLGKQTSLQALHLAVSCLDQLDVTDEAALAVAGIAQSTAKGHAAETRTALKKALASTRTPSVVEQVRPLLVGLESEADRKENQQ